MAMSRSLLAMLQLLGRGAPTRISLIARVPASLLLRSSFSVTGPKLLPWPHFHCSCSPLHGTICLHHVQPINANATTIVDVGESVAEQTVGGLPTRLDCGQQLQSGERCRSLSLVCRAGAENVFAITLLEPPWPIYESLPVLWCSPGRRSNGQIRCSLYSSVRKGSSPISEASVDSGDMQTIEELWELYFADASQWWDNRVEKKNPGSPDFKHKVTRKGLWIDDSSTPAWVKARLKLATEGRLQCHGGCGTRNPQDTAQGRRKANAVPTSSSGLRQIARGGSGSMHLQSASTMREAIAMLRNCLQQGISISSDMYVEVLKRCVKQKDGIEAKQVHDCMMKSGMDQNTYLVHKLLSAYIRCGRLQDARRVFDGLLQKNIISWTIMIGGYAQHSQWKDAMGVFHRMLQAGGQPNAITYLSILKGCASAGALEWVKEVHRHALEAGFESDVRVGSALVHMYAKSGSIEDARLVFDRIEERDRITWNVMIGAYAESGCGEEAYQLFLQMKQEGFKPDTITYLGMLNACASVGALEWVKEVHRHALEAGLVSDVRMCNALVHMYAKSGSIEYARLVFDSMEERDEISWNVMIGAYVESGCGQEAYRLFLQMKREGFKPDAITYVSMLNACDGAGALEWVKEVHRHAMEAGLESDVRVCNTLVHMYAKSGSIRDACLVFDKMEERDGITWNVMIGAYAESGSGEKAYRLFLQMKRAGLKPDTATYVGLLNACASAGALEWVKEVHKHALEAGFESDVRVGSALVHMYAKSGSIEDARLVFDRMGERNLITWNVMIGGLGQHGCGHEALRVFSRMIEDGVMADGTSFVAVLSACSHAGLLDEGRRLFVAMKQDHGIEPTVVHCSCMVDLLGRAGYLEEAKIFISNMPVEPNGATWGALLGGCRTYGNVELGELAAKEIFKLEPMNASPYILLSNIYAAAGKWEEVSLVQRTMQERGIRKEPGRSWIEVGDKVHSFVVGDTSHPEVKEIYAELNSLTGRIKAEGYIPDTRLVLENIDEEDKERALCSHSEKLAIAYGLIHIPQGKPIRVYKNLRVCSDCHTATKFISKVTGREIVARDANRFHHFNDGVCSCGDYW